MPSESSDEQSVAWGFSTTVASSDPPPQAGDPLLEELVHAVRARQSAADRLEDEAAAGLGVHRTAARSLELLSRIGPLGAGELAEALGITPSGTTPLLDRLEELGAIRRVRSAKSDRRRITVELTADGRLLVQRVWGELYEPLAELAQQYGHRELQVVHDFLRRANAVLSGAEIPPRTAPAVGAPVAPEPELQFSPRMGRPETLGTPGRRPTSASRRPTLGR